MPPLNILLVGAGGAFGAICRYVIGTLMTRAYGSGFPVGILFINVTGSLLMGMWVGGMTWLLPGRASGWHALLAVGVLGGYTTFSTFSLDAYLLLEKGQWRSAALYIGGSVLLSIAALFFGLWLMRQVNA